MAGEVPAQTGLKELLFPSMRERTVCARPGPFESGLGWDNNAGYKHKQLLLRY